MKPKIIVLGSSNTDMVIRLDAIPRPGETLLGGEFTMAAGGKGANQAVAAARAGGSVTFIARVGADLFGEQAMAGFRKEKINVDQVFTDPQNPSGVALIFVAKNGENSIAVASGANQHLSPAHVKRAAKAFQGANILVTQLETSIETVTAAIHLAAQNGIPVILNPAPAKPLPASLLKRISILTPNETEAQVLTGIPVTNKTSAAQAATALLGRGVSTVIITLGARGAFVANSEIQELIPGFKVNPVDTVAAGDVFNGALAVAISEGLSLSQAVRFANAAAAISVTRSGAQASAPKRRAIDELLKSKGL